MITNAICVVLHNMLASESSSIISIINNHAELKNVQVFVFLNGNCKFDIKLPEDIQILIVDNNSNKFLAECYLNAANYCKDKKIPWLTFLDHDTVIPSGFFCRIKCLSENKEIAAFPLIYCHGKQISPMITKNGFPDRVILPGHYRGLDFIGINSCATYSVKFLFDLKIIDPDFPLDYLDYAMCKKLSNKNIIVLESKILHDLSVKSKGRVGEFRAESILNSEYLYFRKYRSKYDMFIYKLVLCRRLIQSFLSESYLYSPKHLMKYLIK